MQISKQMKHRNYNNWDTEKLFWVKTFFFLWKIHEKYFSVKFKKKNKRKSHHGQATTCESHRWSVSFAVRQHWHFLPWEETKCLKSLTFDYIFVVIFFSGRGHWLNLCYLRQRTLTKFMLCYLWQRTLIKLLSHSLLKCPVKLFSEIIKIDTGSMILSGHVSWLGSSPGRSTSWTFPHRCHSSLYTGEMTGIFSFLRVGEFYSK